MAKDKLPTFTTPAGIAFFPRLNTPETEVNGQELDTPRFTVRLRLAESDAGVPELLATLDALHQEAIDAAEAEFRKNPKNKTKELVVNPPYRPALNTDGEEIAGEFDLTFKTNAVDKQGNEKKVRILDARGTPCSPTIGGGSKLRVNFSVNSYGPTPMGSGVSFYLNAVQVIELKEWNGGDAASYGFDTEEGGYDSTSPAEGNPFTAPQEDTPETDETAGQEETPAPTPAKKVAPKAAPKAAPAAKPSAPARKRGNF